MKALLMLGIAVLVMPMILCAADKSSEVKSEETAQQLKQFASDLLDIERAVRVHAKSTAPKSLDKDQKASFDTKRHELNTVANAVQDLAVQIEVRERKARRKTLVRTDMESLRIESDSLDKKIQHLVAAGASRQRSINAARLSETIRESESQQETARNKRQTADTAFNNFDQKATQLYNQLSSVMRAMSEMQTGAAKNML